MADGADSRARADRRGWYRALLELDSPESAAHAAAILNHLAGYHSALVRHEVGRPLVTIVLREDDISYACRTSTALLRTVGSRPVWVDVVALAPRWPMA